MDKKIDMPHTNTRYTVQNFLPLIIIFSTIGCLTFMHQLYYGWNFMECMRIIMALFFIIFGFFKIINLTGFAEAYRMYDLIAQRFYWYGYIYPFLELSLGIAYLLQWRPFEINIFTLFLMLISAAGVFNELRKGKAIMCACLGIVFKIPMTYVTLAEDLIMVAMALITLFMKANATK